MKPFEVNRSRRQLLGRSAAATTLVAAGALAPALARAQEKRSISLRIAYQYGLMYAPVLLMKELNLAKRYVSDATIEFRRMVSGAVIRDQIIAKELDLGVLGAPPFLIGWQYTGWKWLAATGIFPFQLVTWREDLKSLKDFKPGDKIAVPGPGSLQQILVAMAAKKQLGNARALDNNMISLPHPDATAAMLSKNPSVAAHFTAVPFLFTQIEAPHIHVVLDGFEAFGGRFTAPMVFASAEFAKARPLDAAVFIAAYNDAVAILNLEPARAAKVLAPGFNQKVEVMQRWLTWSGMTFTSMPYGLLGWHPFMLEAGYLKKAPKGLPDICSDQLLSWIGLEFGGGENAMQRLQRGDT